MNLQRVALLGMKFEKFTCDTHSEKYLKGALQILFFKANWKLGKLLSIQGYIVVGFMNMTH